MNIAVVVRQPPVPIFTGINLIIHNVVKNLAGKNRVRMYLLDQRIPDEGLGFQVEHEAYRDANGALSADAHDDLMPRIARYYHTENRKLLWFRQAIEASRPDVILGFGSDLIGYFGLLDPGVPMVLDVIDSEILYGWRNLATGNIRFSTIKHLMAAVIATRRYLKKCDAVITVGDADTNNIKTFARCHAVTTIPNGVDADYYRPDGGVKPVDGQIVFSGSLNWPPNQQAIQWFLKHCWNDVLKNRPNATLVVVGKAPPDDLRRWLESQPRVSVLGFVDDIRQYLRSSVISIAPMISGSGIKNKILESWATGVPVVSTRLGAHGLGCVDGRHLLVADSPKEFVSAVLRLLDEVGVRQTLGQEGRRNVMEHYSWGHITGQFELLLQRVIDQSPSRRSVRIQR